MAVNPTTKVHLLGKDKKARGKRQSVKALARKLDKDHAFHRCTWRQGTRRALTARFARRRVQVSQDETATLLIEWRDGETEPANDFFISISKVESTKKLVRLVMQRWRIERTYEALKGELGLDHYEGRRFPGWHHHVTVVLACYAFIVAERARRFPPSARRTTRAAENAITPRETLPRQLHHCPACHLADHRHLASSLPFMPSSSTASVTQ